MGGDARRYIDKGGAGGTAVATSMRGTRRDARPYIDKGGQAGRSSLHR